MLFSRSTYFSPRIRPRVAALFLPLLILAAWPAASDSKDEPAEVVVQHLLVGFKKSVRGKNLDRTKKEAEALAEEILQRAKAGEKFGDLVQEYTDDKAPGIYKMVNFSEPRPSRGFHRSQMVPNFGKVAFSLEVGEVGLANYHPGNSPYGWHVIKRLE